MNRFVYAINVGLFIGGMCATSMVWSGGMQTIDGPASQDTIQVEIGGSDGTRYEAHWTITDQSGGTRSFEDSGTVPDSSIYQGQAIEGQITVLSDSGRVEVEVLKSGNRSRSSTEGKGSTVHIRVR